MKFLANSHPLLAALLSGLVLVTGALSAQAGESNFGWVYSLDLQPKGKFEFEQRFDRSVGQQTGTYSLDQYRSEIEYGVTDDFQVAAYANVFHVRADKNYINNDVCPNVNPCTAGFGVPNYYNDTDRSYSNTGGIDGYSLEAIWRLTNPLTSPVGVGLYVEPTVGKLQDSLETRLLLQSNLIDDKLILAGNLSYEIEKEHYTSGEENIIRQSHVDLLYGASYRFAPKLSAGFEGRYHNDFYGYHLNEHIQIANFIGPNLHYAAKDFWITAAWRYQLHGVCMGAGTGDCNDSRHIVSDDHGRNQFIVKIGIPF